MLDFNPHKFSCTGCAACYSACPVSCISMKLDGEGFLYPEANIDTCIQCGLCERVCPIIHPIQVSHYKQQAVAATSKNYQIWKSSTSGGAFSEICNVWADNNTMIIGATWKGLSVHHISVIGAENVVPLRKSKYIASSIDDTFKEALSHLKKGYKVIFSGTPCQVAGLRSFLRKDYDNLLLIDLICHGVGSPEVFRSCIKAIEKQSKKGVNKYISRSKRGSYETDYLTLLTFKDGTKRYITNDQYNQLFLKQLCLRPSCGGNCAFRGKDHRPGDITIADCKGLQELFPSLLGTKKNYSTIVINSQKGELVLSSLRKRMNVLNSRIEDVIKYNPLFDHQTWVSKDRDHFFDEYEKDKEGTIDRWTSPYVESKRSWKGLVFSLLPVGIRKRIIIKHHK